jgi:predicted ribosome quality control (RQC) complex YloA/Tae2 family protein
VRAADGRAILIRRSDAVRVHYFLLHALAAEWDAALRGAVLADAWSQSAGELSLLLEGPGAVWTVRVLCDPSLPLLFRSAGGGRARRNTASLFEGARGRAVTAVRTAERDRFVFFDLDDGTALQLRLFSPQPNAWWVDEGRTIREPFLSGGEGNEAPVPRPAPEVRTVADFEARWRERRSTLAQAVAAAVPLFDRALAGEAVRRAGLDPGADPATADAVVRRRLFETAQTLMTDLRQPRPHVYWRGERAEHLALVPLADPPAVWRAEPFATVDEAVRNWARRLLAQRRFDAAYRLLERALEAAHRKRARSADAMLEELSHPSRAERYERWGHLLMAQVAAEGPGRIEIVLPDLLDEGRPVAIPLDPALSAIDNAERLYRKARQARGARRHAEARWEGVQAEAEAAGALLDRLRALTRYDDLQAFLKEEAGALARFTRPEAVGEERLPYRRFDVHGWEVRVGKNARANAALTTRYAGPHDLWLHARGVPGAHVVLRRPARTAAPPKPVVEAAARIAAHFSEAKTQALVPVQVTERKYVRPVRGGAPGLVRVEREAVLLVEPGLPAQPASQ